MTVLFGDNGSDKSTLVEAIAEGFKLEGLQRVAAKVGEWVSHTSCASWSRASAVSRFAAMTLRYLPYPSRVSTG